MNFCDGGWLAARTEFRAAALALLDVAIPQPSLRRMRCEAFGVAQRTAGKSPMQFAAAEPRPESSGAVSNCKVGWCEAAATPTTDDKQRNRQLVTKRVIHSRVKRGRQ